MKQMKQHAESGFTIIELIVVIAIFAIVVATVVPSVDAFMEQMTAQQAYEIMVAQIGAAQAAAPARGTYTAVHVQRADGHADARALLGVDQDVSFVAIYQLNEVPANSSHGTQWPAGYGPAQEPNTTAGNKWMRFQLASGYETRRIPGSMGFGQISSPFVSGSNFQQTELDDNDELDDFTTFSIVFDANGTLVTTADSGRNVQFDKADTMFNTANNENLWKYDTTNPNGTTPPGELGVRAFTMFDYPELSGTSPNDRDEYLDRVGQFLPVMSYTGEVFRRE